MVVKKVDKFDNGTLVTAEAGASFGCSAINERRNPR